MIYYNSNTINDWNYGSDNIVKVYRNNAVCYYKITGGGDVPTAQTPCYAVVDDISQYSDTEFEDVFNKADEKWYKLNNLNQYEEYGVYGDSIASGSSRLPAGYTEVEYIENTGTTTSNGAYLNLGLPLYNTIGNSFQISSRLKSEFYSASGYDDLETIINSESVSSPYYGFVYRYAHSNHNIELSSNPSNHTTLSTTANTDGTTSLTISCNSTSVTDQVPLGLFAFYNANYNTPYRFAKATIYSLTVVKNGVTVRDLVPAKRDIDAKYGLYDLITDTFYTSPNGNNFSGGSAVTPSAATYYEGKLAIVDGYEYQYSGNSWVNLGEVSGSTYIEYLERDSSHNGYVGLGEYFQANTRIQIDFQLTNIDGFAVVGDYFNNDNDDWRFFLGAHATSDKQVMYDFDRSRIKVALESNFLRYNWEVGNYYIKDLNTDNIIVSGTPHTNFSRPNQMYLFNLVGTTSQQNLDYGHIYSVKIYQNNALVKDYIPWTDGNGNYGLYDNVSSSVTQSIGSMTGATSSTTEYPKYYDEIQDPPNNVSFSSMAEAESYECPWVGMNATIDGDKYVFSGDSISGYEWVEQTLPYDAEIEYLESTGTQYINTNIYLNTSSFEIGYSVLGNRGHWGYVHNNVVNGAWVTVDETTVFFGSWNNTDKVSVSSYISSTENTIVYTQNGAIINGTTISKNLNLRGVDNLASVPLLFFALHDFYNNSLIYSNSKYKNFYIKVNDVLVRDMIPVRVGQVGYMYDKVSGELFGNAGTGDFILGADKN